MVVLVLACVNVANILLVRATIREREMAIRAALGAARGRLMRQLLTESILLAVLGGAAGILLGAWGSAVAGSIRVGVDLPVHLDFGLDWRIFAFAFGAALLTGLIVGAVPAIRIARANLSSILHEGGRSVAGGKHRVRSVLVAAQVAGSLMLLIIAGLFTRSLQREQKMDLGFQANGVVNFTMDPAEIGYDEARGLAFYKALLDRVHELPGVESASLTTAVPMGYFNNADTLTIDGFDPPAGQAAPFAVYGMISPEYFRTLQIPLLRGRTFTDADDKTAPRVAVVNETMVHRFWHDVGSHRPAISTGRGYGASRHGRWHREKFAIWQRLGRNRTSLLHARCAAIHGKFADHVAGALHRSVRVRLFAKCRMQSRHIDAGFAGV